MYTIGEFAAFGRVSVRMLRHYDSIGLLEPAQVDPHNGYRYYSNDQLRRLLRIVELRELGVGLDAISDVVHADDTSAAYYEALQLRKAQLTASLETDAARLARIDERLRRLQGEIPMTTIDYRTIAPVTVYAARGVAPGIGPQHIGPVIGPLIGALDGALESAGRPMIEPGVFWYEAIDGSEDVNVSVSYIAEDPPVEGPGWQVITLPEVFAATTLHKGDMTGIGDSWMALTDQLIADGYSIAGPAREVYLEADGHEPGPTWVTELQVPVTRS